MKASKTEQKTHAGTLPPETDAKSNLDATSLEEDKSTNDYSLANNSSAELSKATLDDSSQLAAQVAKLEKKLVQQDKAISDHEKRRDTLEALLEDQMISRDQLEVKLAWNEKKIAQLTSHVRHLVEENVHLESKLENEKLASQKLKELEAKLVISQEENDAQAYFIEEQRVRIDTLESEYVEKVSLAQKLDQVIEENEELKEMLRLSNLQPVDRSTISEKNSNILEGDGCTDTTSTTTVKEYADQQAACVLDCLNIEVQRYESEITLLNSKLQKSHGLTEALKEQNNTLLESTKCLEQQMKLAECSMVDAREREQNLNEKISHWACKAYDFKVRAEEAERKLTFCCESTCASTDSEQENQGDIQSRHLQAALDDLATPAHSTSQHRKTWQSFVPQISFRGSSDEDEKNISDQKEDVLQKYVEQNALLENQVSKAQSDLVKLQTQFREESYKSWKKLQQLQSENDAYLLKNAALVKLCGEVNFPPDDAAHHEHDVGGDGVCSSQEPSPPSFVHVPFSTAH